MNICTKQAVNPVRTLNAKRKWEGLTADMIVQNGSSYITLTYYKIHNNYKIYIIKKQRYCSVQF